MMAFGLMMASCAANDGARLTINLPKGDNTETVVVSHVLIDDMLKARRQSDLNVAVDTLKVKDGKAVMAIDPAGPANYVVAVAPGVQGDLFAAPGENIVMDVKSVSPFDYSVSGTPLMEGMTKLVTATKPIEAEYYALMDSGKATEETVMPIMERYDKAVKDFIAANPDSPAVPFAILDLSGEDFIKAYEALTPEARKSIMMPIVEAQLPRVRKQLESDRQREAMLKGDTPAPGFTLPDLDGKMVSLSDYRGKWVVLDFWGSWCGWCVKGFPELKEAYAKYGDRLVIIGVDCNEPEEAWKAGVRKYELPWVNVYYGQPADPALLTQYGISGFPTKGIVNPEGKLVDLTVGHDPTFFDRLAGFLGK